MANKTYVRRSRIRGGVENILQIGDEWYLGDRITTDTSKDAHEYVDVDSIDQYSNRIWDYLKNLLIYNNIGNAKYYDVNGNLYIIPLYFADVYKNEQAIINEQYDNIVDYIKLIFGLALDDDNQSYINIVLRYFEEYKKWGIKIQEV